MHERLRSLLSGISTNEQSDLIVRAVALIEARGFVDFQDSLEQDFAGFSNQPGEIVQYLITQRLVPFYSNILQTMGVELAEDTVLSDYVDMLEWMSAIENFDDVDTLNSLAISDNDDQEILADILAVVSAKDAEEIFPLLESVSPYLIERIADMTSVEAIEIQEQSEAYRRAFIRTSRLLNWMESRPEYKRVTDTVVPLLRMGKDTSSMLPNLRPLYVSQTLQESAAAVALVYLASSLEDSQLAERAGEYIQTVTPDTPTAIAAIRFMTAHFAEASNG